MNHHLTLFILLLFSIEVAAAPFDYLYKSANEFFGAGFPLIASRLYRQAASQAADDIDKIKALGGYTVSAEELCLYEDATDAVETILKLDPENTWASDRRMHLRSQTKKADCTKKSDLKTLEKSYTSTLWPRNLEALPLIANEEAYLETPMRFFCFLPCSGNDPRACGSYILAIGSITEDTPADFERALQGCPVDRVEFNSPGGNLSSGLQLGMIIRDKKLNTGLGFPNKVEYWFKERSKKDFLIGNPAVIQNPICLSACAYAFLGGVERLIADDAEYGVHQFKSSSEAINETETQSVTGVIGAYLLKLSISRDLLQLALWTGPTDVYMLNRDQLEELDVVTHKKNALSAWTIEAFEDGTIAAKVQTHDERYTNRLDIFLLMREGRNYRAILATRLFESITSQPEYIQQCREILDKDKGKPYSVDKHEYSGSARISSSIGSYAAIKLNEFHQGFSYDYELTDDGEFAVSFTPSSEIVNMISSGNTIDVYFNSANVCRPFQMRLSTISTENQKNAVRAIMRR